MNDCVVGFEAAHANIYKSSLIVIKCSCYAFHALASFPNLFNY